MDQMDQMMDPFFRRQSHAGEAHHDCDCDLFFYHLFLCHPSHDPYQRSHHWSRLDSDRTHQELEIDHGDDKC